MLLAVRRLRKKLKNGSIGCNPYEEWREVDRRVFKGRAFAGGCGPSGSGDGGLRVYGRHAGDCAQVPSTDCRDFGPRFSSRANQKLCGQPDYREVPGIFVTGCDPGERQLAQGYVTEF